MQTPLFVIIQNLETGGIREDWIERLNAAGRAMMDAAKALEARAEMAEYPESKLLSDAAQKLRNAL